MRVAPPSDAGRSAGTASKLPPFPSAPTPQPGTTPGRNPAMGKVEALPQAAAGPPLTEAEILKFITDRVGNTPFADSAKLQKTERELGALIKQRGTAFLHDSAISDFGQKISALGMTSEVTGPLSHNYGPPNKQDWLWGSWVTSKVGLPVKYVEGNKLMLWTEIGAANTGKVTINPDGTYVWHTDSAQGVIHGKWHEASIAEMADQGGAEVVWKMPKTAFPGSPSNTAQATPGKNGWAWQKSTTAASGRAPCGFRRSSAGLGFTLCSKRPVFKALTSAAQTRPQSRRPRLRAVAGCAPFSEV